MAINKNNLKIPTSEEARINGRKGGIASGKARRKRKAFKEACEMLLNLEVSSDKNKKKLLEMGIDPEDMNNMTLMLVGLFKKATMGDVGAFKEIRNMVGEDDNAEVMKRLDDMIDTIENSIEV